MLFPAHWDPDYRPGPARSILAISANDNPVLVDIFRNRMVLPEAGW
jgi:hypothetical protein